MRALLALVVLPPALSAQEPDYRPYHQELILQIGLAEPVVQRKALARLCQTTEDPLAVILQSVARSRLQALRRGLLAQVLQSEELDPSTLGPGLAQHAARLFQLVQAAPELHIPTLAVLGRWAPYLGDRRERIQELIYRAIKSQARAFARPGIAMGYVRCMVSVQQPVPELIAKLEDPISPLRACAAEALGAQGVGARAAIPALLRALAAEHPPRLNLKLGGRYSTGYPGTPAVRAAVARALIRIAPEDRRITPACFPFLHLETSTPFLLQAIHCMGLGGEAARPGLPKLSLLLRAENPRIAAAAATSLGMLGIPHPQALNNLHRATLRPEREVAAKASAALETLRKVKLARRRN